MGELDHAPQTIELVCTSINRAESIGGTSLKHQNVEWFDVKSAMIVIYIYMYLQSFVIVNDVFCPHWQMIA
jgi:hypothetical protein